MCALEMVTCPITEIEFISKGELDSVKEYEAFDENNWISITRDFNHTSMINLNVSIAGIPCLD